VNVLVGAALLVGLFVVLPAVAHLLRRGRASVEPFPPVSLVPAARTVARRKRRIEDRLLLSVRAATVLLLAVLGATPLVNCSRLSLGRGAGGSVALAIVLDDSLSMRAKSSSGSARWDRALEAAEELLASAREGDSVALVLAGKPARVALGATTDLGLARRTLSELSPSDRATDLGAAVGLARSALVDPARRDRRLVVLSDFAAEAPPPGEPRVWAPVPALTEPLPDCGVVAAESRENGVRVTLACNDPGAARNRAVELVLLKGSGVEPSSAPGPKRPTAQTALARAEIEPRVGVQTVMLDPKATKDALAVRLSGSDSLIEDDLAPVASETRAMKVAVLGSPAEQQGPTGGPPLLEQAIGALQAGVTVTPLSVLPDQATELTPYALLVLDDPAGIGPEARDALTAHVSKGAVAAAFLGPRVEATKLGSALEPFARGSVRWQADPQVLGVSPPSLAWLGEEAASLRDLDLRGRTLFDAGTMSGARVLGTMADGAPFLVEQRMGRGTLLTVTLPCSLEQSDLALRPGFVALLAHLVDTAERSRGVRQSVAGAAWAFDSDRPLVQGPNGPVDLRDTPEQGWVASPAVRGLYRVKGDKHDELRTVVLDPAEVTAQPSPPPPGLREPPVRGGAGSVDVSSETALLLVLLLALELGLRFVRGARSQPVDAPEPLR